jgi:ligand-binding sensor domain-containing protein/signal transduction histidine kinase
MNIPCYAATRLRKTLPPPHAWAVMALLSLMASAAKAEQLPIKLYSGISGLGSSYVVTVVRDSNGLLWFCTRDGLSRFDGQQFVTYNLEHGLPHPTVNHLLKTRDGTYWIATNGVGVCRFNPEAESSTLSNSGKRLQTLTLDKQGNRAGLFEVYSIPGRGGENYVNVIYEDRAGRIWVGTDNGLYQIQQGENGVTFQLFPLLEPSPTNTVMQLLEDHEGSLWIATSQGLTRRLPDGQLIHYRVNPANGTDLVYAMLEGDDHSLWFGHTSGFLRFYPQPLAELGNRTIARRQLFLRKASTVHSPWSPARVDEALWYTTLNGVPLNPTLALYRTADRRLWFGTYNGLVVYDGQQFKTYTTAQGLSDNQIQTMVEDNAGNLWMGTRNSGAMRLALNGLVTFNQADGLNHTEIHNLIATPAGEVFAADATFSINRFSNSRFMAIHPQVPIDRQVGWLRQGAFLDRDGGWWILTPGGLYGYGRLEQVEQMQYRAPEMVFTEQQGLSSNDIFRLFKDSQENIWVSIGTPSHQLMRFDLKTGRFQAYNEGDGMPAKNSAAAFAEDSAGRIWMGLYLGGLLRYDAGRLKIFTTEDGLPPMGVLAVHLDRRERLWIATSGGGLARLDNLAAEKPHFVTYTTADGLLSNNLRCLAEDGQGHIYIGSVRGVDRLDPQTGYIRHYTTDNGLANDFVTCVLRDPNDTMWFGTLKGLSRLLPEPENRLPAPQVFISDLQMASVRQPVSELGESYLSGFELDADQNRVQISFFGLNYSTGEVLRYQYKLEGAAADWSLPAPQRTVDYASLQPGVYRFLVRAVLADGTVSERPAQLSFTILPPVWRRWWFITLMTLSLAALVYAAYRYRLKRLLEVERVRIRIATDLHDDIGASLSRMAILSEVVKQQTGALNMTTHQMLTDIAGSARSLVDSMSDIVWAIDPRKDDLRSVAQRIRQFASDVLESQQIRWSFETPAELEKIKLSPDERRQLYLIFKEAINNIAKHSGAGEAKLRIFLTGNKLCGEVEDNGRGFALPDPEVSFVGMGGNGLRNMQARAREVGGTLDIDSGSGKGSRLTLLLPVKKLHFR